jgi:hypothetical protein
MDREEQWKGAGRGQICFGGDVASWSNAFRCVEERDCRLAPDLSKLEMEKRIVSYQAMRSSF